MKTMNKTSITIAVAVFSLGFFGGFFGTTTLAATNPAGNLEQCANGSISSPEECIGDAWQNGNLNHNQAHYSEGQSVPFRIVLTDVSTSSINTLVIEYDIKHGDGHAYDYLTSYDRTETSADPCSGISPCALTETAPIPAPSSTNSPTTGMPTNSFNSLPASERVVSLFNGSLAGTGITYVSEGDLNASDSSTRVKIQFEASSSTVVFAYGGHIASAFDWGAGNAASEISGSPYHMRLIELNGQGGNQDRSLSASAVLPADTSNEDPPQLIVNKVVLNNSGGTKVISDFQLFVDGASVTSGVSATTTVGSHTVSEANEPGYTTSIGGDCAANGTVTLALGDIKTCTVTNDDIATNDDTTNDNGAQTTTNGESSEPPLISLVKVPSPLNLPNGSGTVTYTYTLHNTGTVPVTDVSLVGDTCSPITLASGDVNADAVLGVDETWIYTCSATLSKTHTNIITATGLANGISATDTANATVIVGSPTVPPLVHVTIVPSSRVLPAGGGVVEYTYIATNPGTASLSNVRLFDDSCAPVTLISGDANGNLQLDANETWIYTCSTTITQNTTNTVTVSGDANGLTARDFAIAPILVNAAANVPAFPNAGLPPSEHSTPWSSMIPIGILALLGLLYLMRRKQTA